MVCNIGGQLGTKVVISALGMLALYMRFNGTGIWGGETTGDSPLIHSHIRTDFSDLIQITRPRSRLLKSKTWPSNDNN